MFLYLVNLQMLKSETQTNLGKQLNFPLLHKPCLPSFEHCEAYGGWDLENGGDRCSILEMQSPEPLLERISAYSRFIFRKLCSKWFAGRFGNRYFENLNQYEEVPG